MPLWFFFSLIAVGLIVGALAYSVVHQVSIAGTVALGLAGSFLGGVIAWLFIDAAVGLVFAVIGASALIYVRDRFVSYG
jgi:uncharacterized membrane protein YeaQ/YmgE (transglycosylase-associated protein family)